MASSLVLAEKLIAMLIMAAVGYVVVKVGFLKAEASKMLSNLTVYVLVPCMIINAFQSEITSERMKGFIVALVFSVVIYVVWITLNFLLKKPLKLGPIDEATLIYCNVGNLMLPLVEMTLGEGMVFYAVALQIPFNLLFWTHGRNLISGEKGIDIKKVFLNTNIISMAIGLILMFCNFTLPDMVSTVVTGFADTVGPISMITIGMTIASQSLANVFKCKKAYCITFMRLVVYPMIAIGLLYGTGILRQHRDLIPVLQVIIMSFAAPPAALVTQLALIYDNDAEHAGIYNVLGIILCVITIPLINYVYQLIFA